MGLIMRAFLVGLGVGAEEEEEDRPGPCGGAATAAAAGTAAGAAAAAAGRAAEKARPPLGDGAAGPAPSPSTKGAEVEARTVATGTEARQRWARQRWVSKGETTISARGGGSSSGSAGAAERPPPPPPPPPPPSRSSRSIGAPPPPAPSGDTVVRRWCRRKPGEKRFLNGADPPLPPTNTAGRAASASSASASVAIGAAGPWWAAGGAGRGCQAVSIRCGGYILCAALSLSRSLSSVSLSASKKGLCVLIANPCLSLSLSLSFSLSSLSRAAGGIPCRRRWRHSRDPISPHRTAPRRAWPRNRSHVVRRRARRGAGGREADDGDASDLPLLDPSMVLSHYTSTGQGEGGGGGAREGGAAGDRRQFLNRPRLGLPL